MATGPCQLGLPISGLPPASLLCSHCSSRVGRLSILKYAGPGPAVVFVFIVLQCSLHLEYLASGRRPPRHLVLRSNAPSSKHPPDHPILHASPQSPPGYSLAYLFPTYFLHNTYCSLKLPCSFVYLFSVPSSSSGILSILLPVVTPVPRIVSGTQPISLLNK